MEPKGDEKVLWCFMYITDKTLEENYKKAYELWRVRNPMMRLNIDAKLSLKEKNYILKVKRITIIENDDKGKYYT